MDFSSNPDHQAIREGVAAVVKQFGDDYWLERDEDGNFPREFHRAMADAGWLGITMPTEYGGAGLGVTEAAIMMHEVASHGGGMSATSTVHINLFGPHPIVVFGTEEQKARWIPRLISGEDQGCFGFTQPDAGHGTAVANRPEAPPIARAPQGAPAWERVLPFIGPIVLFIIWDLAVRSGLIKAILLPPPLDALGALVRGLAGGPLLNDFLVTVWRTLQAFLIAATVGMPLGVLLGSNEKAYRSVEFLIDFFRSTPSSALIPLFLMIFGVSDVNKVAIAAFGAFLIVLFNSAYGVINARKQRVMDARVMGASRWQVFRGVLIWESL